MPLRRRAGSALTAAFLALGGACVWPGIAAAQVDVGGAFDCLLGVCDANAQDEGGDHHGVDAAAHLAEARAEGNGAARRSAFAEVGLRFRPCFSGPVDLGVHDIDIVGRLRGFGGGPVIRGEADVRVILRDVTDDLELSNDVIFDEVEEGQIGTTVNRDFDRNAEHFLTANLVENHTYDLVLRVATRKFGLNGMADFQQGDRGVSFDRISVYPDLDDTDGDGLFDQWEISGLDEDCDGVPEVDLPALGADPTVKDLFVELDWMTGEAPTRAAVRAVVDAFAQAPGTAGGVNTPGQGIALRIDTGDLTDPTASEDGGPPGTCGDGIDNGGADGADQSDTDCLVGDPVFSTLGGGLGGGNEFPIGGVPSLGNDADDDGRTDFEEAKMDPAQGNFDPARRWIFRYGINSVPDGPAPDFGGQAGGNDFLLFNQNAGLLMHELGHTLGLSHGGPDEGVNCKPNYVSVMNYRFQGGIQVAGGLGSGQDIDGDGTPDGFILDYSPPRFPNGRGLGPLLPVDETAWDETIVQDVSDPANLTAWTTSDQTLRTGMLSAAPDWNGDGDSNDQAPPSIDFNTSIWVSAGSEDGVAANSCSDGIDNDGDGLTDINDPSCIANSKCGTAANAGVTDLSGANDWDNIELDPKRFSQMAAGDIPLFLDEPTLEDILLTQAAMQTADLAVVSKVADPDPVAAGQPLTYVITVENRGPNATTEASVTDTLPPELIFLDGAPGCALAGGSDVVCAIGGLDPGQSREVEIRARVRVDVACAPGEQFTPLLNSASVENIGGFDPEPGNNLGRVRSEALCARYEYSAKYVCGVQGDEDDLRLARGAYRTVVNIHNPDDEDVHFFKKLALAFPPEEQRPGEIVPIAIDRLAYDQALKVDCGEARGLVAESRTGYVEGYLVIQSPLSLDVDAVYTVETMSRDGELQSVSMDVERIDERERRIAPRPDLAVLPAHPEPPIDPNFGTRLPEGVPNSLYCGDNGPAGGPARSVDAIVRNIGEGDAGPSTLRIEFDGAGPVDVAVGALASGEDATFATPIPRGCYGPGSCTFALEADADADLMESEEGNNTASSLCLAPAG